MSCKVNGRFFEFAFAALCFAGSLIFVRAEKCNAPKIVIVGAGAAGIAAATELVQQNFDVTILEAAGRIGGRIHTHKFGNILIDRGAQWVNGEQGNPVWEVANPLGLLENQSRNLTTYQFYTSDGKSLEIETVRNLTERIRTLWANYIEGQNETFPVLAMKEIDKFYDENPNMGYRKEFEHWLQEMVMNFGILDTWDEVVPHEPNWGYPGDWNMNWKEKGFSMIFDIMTKKYPDPKQEIPVMEKVRFRKEVKKIDYSGDNVKIHLSDEEIIEADDVIFTPSLGYLKAHYTTLFKPSLPDEKIHVIKNFGFGDSTKILMLFNRPWWNQNTETGAMNILWTKKEIESRKNDALREWQNHVLGFSKIEHKPNLLLMWVNGQGARDVERIPQDLLVQQVMELLEYIKEDRVVEPPIKITRTMWNSNKHVLGTCSFRGTQAWKNNINIDVLQKGIPEDNPRLWLAGEATDPKAYGSVSGAINSGRQQARKIVEKYKEK